jgi:glucose/arabinose dehydrogenase
MCRPTVHAVVIAAAIAVSVNLPVAPVHPIYASQSAQAGSPARQRSDEQPFWFEEIQRNLNGPSSITWLPSGEALVAERNGRWLRFSVDLRHFQGVRGVPAVHYDLLNGFKYIAVDPAFASHRTVYLLISEGEGIFHAAVYKAVLDGTSRTGLTLLYRGRAEVSTGLVAERIIVLKDDIMLVSLPITSEKVMEGADLTDTPVGKVVRIALDGTPPPASLPPGPGALPGIGSYGHRVGMGIVESCDRSIWGAETGPRGGDELNLLLPGRNYGWPVVTWGFDYDGKPISAKQRSLNSEDPRLVWPPSITPSSIAQITGGVYPRWRGDFLVGTLPEGSVRHLQFVCGQVQLQEVLLDDLGERVRDVKSGPDGHPYALTDNRNGRIIQLNLGALPCRNKAAGARISQSRTLPRGPGERPAGFRTSLLRLPHMVTGSDRISSGSSAGRSDNSRICPFARNGGSRSAGLSPIPGPMSLARRCRPLASSIRPSGATSWFTPRRIEVS